MQYRLKLGWVQNQTKTASHGTWRGYKPHQLAGTVVGQNTSQTQPAPIPTLQTGMIHPWGQTATPDSRTPSLRLPVDLVAQEGTSPATADLRPSSRGSSPQKMALHVVKSCLYQETLQLYHLHLLSTIQDPHPHGNSFLFKHFCSSIPSGFCTSLRSYADSCKQNR